MKKILLSALVFVASTFAAHAIEGELSGRFTINAEGDTVHFSKGNLYYQSGSLGGFSFSDQQYKTPEDGSNSGSIQYRSLFGFGTSGWNSGANAYQPMDTISDPSNYLVGGSAENGLTGDYAYADWGIYNPIKNGGNTFGLWRVLTMDEWWYILAGRENAQNLFSMGRIKWTDDWDHTEYTYNGLILLPDNWVLPEGAKKFRPGTQDAMIYDEIDKMYRNMNLDLASTYELNTYTPEQWAVMEAAGAVFLPADGHRKGGEIVSRNGTYGRYASSTPYSEICASMLVFDKAWIENSWYNRSWGVSVRLVTRPDSDYQGIDNAQSHKAAKKVLRDGQVLILMDGKQLNILGAEVK